MTGPMAGTFKPQTKPVTIEHVYELVRSGTGDGEPATTTKTVTVGLGTPDPKRRMVIFVSNAGTGLVVGVTLDGAAMTKITGVGTSGGTAQHSAWTIAKPTGTTGTVVITLPTSTNLYGIDVFALQNVNDASPTNTYIPSAANPSATVSCPVGGVILACSMFLNTAAITTAWSGLTPSGSQPYKSGTMALSVGLGGFPSGGNVGVTCTTTPTATGGCGIFMGWK